jgi:hypothetical protein
MSPHIRKVVTAALVVAVSSTAVAGVVRDKTGNPGLQVGGQPLLHHAAPPIPYSFIGALAQCAVWPWGWLIGFTPYHFHFHHHRPHPPY